MFQNGVEAFLAVVSHHSLSGAAEHLHLTQPALSRRLRELESHLGVVLIDRQKGIRRSSLTQAGESFYPLAERWSQLWHETRGVATSASSLALTIGCVDSVNTYVLPPLYRDLLSHRPTVHLRIYTLGSLDLYGKIERREMDVAFVLQTQRYLRLRMVPFLQEPMLVVRPHRRRALPATVRASKLDPRYELYVNWGPAHQTWHDHTWDPLQRAEIELDTVTLIRTLMDDPRHWALAPASAAQNFLASGRLGIQRLEPPPPDRITYMITHRFPRPGARQGIEILESLARRRGFFVPPGAKSGPGRPA